MAKIATIVGGTVPLLLFAVGLYFLVRLRGFYLLHPLKTVRYAAGKGKKRDALSSLAVALGGTLGVGNVTGVTSALFIGGPGALFWMWCSAVLSMGLHYAEVLLALDTAAPPGLPRYLSGRVTGKLFPLALLFLSLTLGGGLQSAAAAEAGDVTLSLPPVFTGALLAVPVALVTVGGFTRIRAVASRLIPLLTLLFSLLCLGVIVSCRAALPGVLRSVFFDAFSLRAAAGGGIGAAIKRASVGFRRGLLSNEGGCGTASVAHAAAETVDPIRQGVYGVYEVATDTLLLCTLTGLAVLTAGCSGEGVAPLLSAFSSVYGRGAGILLFIALFLFAFATAVTYCFYGRTATVALTGGSGGGFPYLVAFFLLFGVFIPRDFLFFCSDLFLGVLAVLNLAALMKRADRILLLSAPLSGVTDGTVTPRDARPTRRRESSKEVARRRPRAARRRRRTRIRSSRG